MEELNAFPQKDESAIPTGPNKAHVQSQQSQHVGGREVTDGIVSLTSLKLIMYYLRYDISR